MKIERTFQVRNGRTDSKRMGKPGPVLPWGQVAACDQADGVGDRFQQLIDDREVADYAALARAGNVTRARLSRIMNLLNLAPDTQEEIPNLPRSEGRYVVSERDLRPIAAEVDWLKAEADMGTFGSNRNEIIDLSRLEAC